MRARNHTRPWHERRWHGRGFTLIEVLAALVIVSLGMLGGIEAVSQTAHNDSYLRDKMLAHWVAMNRLTEVRLDGQAPKVDKTSDEVEMAGRRWRWTMTVTQSPLPSVRRIDISVRPSEAKEGTSLAFVTGFYGTAIAQPGTVAIMWQGVPTQNPRNPNNPRNDNNINNNQQNPAPPPQNQTPPQTPPETPPDDQQTPEPQQ